MSISLGDRHGKIKMGKIGAEWAWVLDVVTSAIVRVAHTEYLYVHAKITSPPPPLPMGYLAATYPLIFINLSSILSKRGRSSLYKCLITIRSL